jgi:hypothetical protein
MSLGTDIVNKCMFNMAEVTDSEEIHLAATQVHSLKF